MNRELMQHRNAEKLSEMNRARNDAMREKITNRLQTVLDVLLDFARDKHVPERAPMPPSLPMIMNEHSIQNLPYRNYMVRKHIEQARRTLDEVRALPSKAFAGFMCDKVVQQEQAVLRLLTVLGVPVA